MGNKKGGRSARAPRQASPGGIGDLGAGAIDKMKKEGFDFGGMGGSVKLTDPKRGRRPF